MMSSTVLITLFSGSALLLVSLLFGLLGRLSSESMYQRLMSALDRRLIVLGKFFSGLRYRLGLATVRMSVHFLVHQALHRLRTGLTWLTKYIRGLEKTNREKARSFKKATKQQGHLHEVAVHKKAVSLTDKQKLELKRTKLSAK